MSKEQTKDFEGFRFNIYKDTQGNNTIGFGFNIDDKLISSMLSDDVIKGKRPINLEESNKVFDVLYNRSEDDARNFIGDDTFDSLDEEKKGVIVDMSYNLGLSKLKGFKKFKEAVVQGDSKTAAEELVDSKWFKQVGRRSRHHVKVFDPEFQFSQDP